MQSIIMIVTGIFSLFLRSQPMLFYVIYITLCLLSGYFSTFIINVPMISYFQKNIEINQQTQFFFYHDIVFQYYGALRNFYSWNIVRFNGCRCSVFNKWDFYTCVCIYNEMEY